MNQESLSFDLVFDNEKAECPPLHQISNVKILAVMKKQSLLRNILELDFKKTLKDQVFNQKGHFIKMKMLNLDVIQILDSSTIIMGHFENSGTGYKQKGTPPSFFTINLMYIDLLKRITKVGSILNPKYCDIDSTFGLHDYTITIDLRNQKQTFF